MPTAAENFWYTCQLALPEEIPLCGLSVAGITDVWLTLQSIKKIDTDNNGLILDIFDSTSSYLTALRLPIPQFLAGYVENQELTDNGLRYTGVLTASSKGYNHILTQYLLKYSQSKFNAVIKTAENQYWFIQNLRYASNVLTNGILGTEITGRLITLNSNSLDPARQLSSFAIANITFTTI